MKRRDYNFELMSSAELWDLCNELTSRLAARLQGEVTLLQQRLDEIEWRVRAHPGRDRGTRKHAAVAKFRNPRAPFQTWSGRGTRPLWVKDVLEHGGTMVSLRIEAFTASQNEEAHPA